MFDHYHLNVQLEILNIETLRSIQANLTDRRDELWKRIDTGPSDPDTDRAIIDEISELDDQILKLRLEISWRKSR